MKQGTAVIVGLLVALPALVMPSIAAANPADDRQVVAQLDLAFQAAVKRNDADAMDRILHDDFVLILGNGNEVSRDELLRESRDMDNSYEQQDEIPGTQTVRVFGDTAVVTAKLWIKGSGNNGAFDRKLWFSDTYVRTPAGWRYAFAQASLSLPPDEAAVRNSIDVASHEFDDAQLRKDAAALNRFLAKDFKFVRGSGKFTGRDEFIAIFSDPGLSFDPFVITEREIVMLGPDAGIVIADGRMSGKGSDGRPFADHFRFADTFERRDGRWQVVYVQVTPLPN
jgi:ketosteroid isomerase-like protein